MLLFPFAKINLGLSVKNKRPDGFHAIESVLCRIPFYDILEINPSTTDTLTLSGLPLTISRSENLVWKTLLTLRKLYDFPPVSIHLHKQIPPKTGLGGGSSDAAHFLNGITQLFKLAVSQETLFNIAASLGSDCPFFMQNHPQFASGRGEVLSSFSLPVSQLKMLLLIPKESISTADAYQNIGKYPRTASNWNFAKQPVTQWKELLWNDFEPFVFERYPYLATLKDTLYKSGANFVSLSGSGSALYAFFPKETPIKLPENIRHYWFNFPV